MDRVRKSDFFSIVLVLCFVLNSLLCNGGVTSRYVRKLEATIDMPLDSDVFRVPCGYNAPQQVHITQGDVEGKAVIVSWVTQEAKGSNKVIYWKDNSSKKHKAHGKTNTYKFYNYTSGYIHHCPIRNLEYDTKYYYVVGVGQTERMFWFFTPPEIGPDVPYTFGLIGDLGQSYDSNITLTHYENNPTKGQAVLLLAISHTLILIRIMTIGDGTVGEDLLKEAQHISLGFGLPETMNSILPPRSGKTDRLSHSRIGTVLLIGHQAAQNHSEEFPKVNRTETPWLIVLMHSPWYNSYDYHYMEGETMRVMYEAWFVKYKVDVVFAGHVHAYERSERVSNIAYNVVNGICTPVKDQSAPVYITIGDGGNIEGLATKMTEPQPKYSAYREASFGHAIFSIKNRTHARYGWHRNHDGYAVEGDRMWFFNRFWHPIDDSPSCNS
ncbi:unnamed protein product [Arabidopsis arenosa]|uniref:Purple acid phosphatase n=1 Tax=Arabidopsis arenosa TaxID=38785 RepID=A0A8S1ZMI8_ARAAE|nr:unnamed protein product [Arabidopsis arenosa]